MSLGQRRVPGLRREEVAAHAGISVDHYIRLEQGRENRPSAQVLDSLSEALRLEDDARAHLYQVQDWLQGASTRRRLSG
ncbi:helix-turn-helix domain-containing protein [Actinomadura sp. CNU-125]|uniref:helix-turn-helix domain-containing protein n=1 Tax=Actinomadura sp. CNU-125 TaxID=1904961 RepID=UPI0021CCED21|nr:helix-turn-helix transcriptional regulator [Actinomadura sp. CNU-125]